MHCIKVGISFMLINASIYTPQSVNLIKLDMKNMKILGIFCKNAKVMLNNMFCYL